MHGAGPARNGTMVLHGTTFSGHGVLCDPEAMLDSMDCFKGRFTDQTPHIIMGKSMVSGFSIFRNQSIWTSLGLHFLLSSPGVHLGQWPMARFLHRPNSAWLAGVGYAVHGEPCVGLDVWGTSLPLLRCLLDLSILLTIKAAGGNLWFHQLPVTSGWSPHDTSSFSPSYDGYSESSLYHYIIVSLYHYIII